MSKSKSSTTRRRLGRAGIATGAATTLLAALSAAPAYAAPGTLALSSIGGPGGGGNTIVATLATMPTSPNPTSFTSSSAMYFVVAASATATSVTCPATYPTTAPASNLVAAGSPAVKLLSPGKIAVTVPAGVVVTAGGIYRYGACAYASNSSGASLIAGAQYTVGTKPTISAVNGISPLSGPALGGTAITVTGTGFVANTATQPNNTIATIDGMPLADVTVSGTTQFTAKTPPHAAGGPFLLSVTTPGGTVNTLGTSTTKANLFSYTNGIVVSPNTAPNYRGNVDLDVLGVGFDNYTFDATTGSSPVGTTAHVYLTPYNGYSPVSNSGVKTRGQLTECINVLVISNEELLCTLPLNHTYTSVASPVLTTVAARTGLDLVATSGSTSVTSPDAEFTQADVGLPISSAGGTSVIASDTTIASVQSKTQATLSTAAASDGSLTDVSVGGPRSNISGTVGADKKTITASAGTFKQADIGRLISSATAVWPTNLTTIVSVSADGTTAVTSDAGTTAGAATDIIVTPSTPVPDGSYTITVVNDGSVGAQSSSTYKQSIISSGASFTVADY